MLIIQTTNVFMLETGKNQCHLPNIFVYIKPLYYPWLTVLRFSISAERASSVRIPGWPTWMLMKSDSNVPTAGDLKQTMTCSGCGIGINIDTDRLVGW